MLVMPPKSCSSSSHHRPPVLEADLAGGVDVGTARSALTCGPKLLGMFLRICGGIVQMHRSAVAVRVLPRLVYVTVTPSAALAMSVIAAPYVGFCRRAASKA